MSMPIILLVGQAGSGKDTVGNFIVQNFNATTIALADPMKRFVANVFGFTEEQLWGPSELRNAPDRRFIKSDKWLQARLNFEQLADEFINRLISTTEHPIPAARYKAKELLLQWSNNLEQHFDDTTKDHCPTPRYILQTLGTQWGRHIDKNIWVNYTKKIAKELLGGGYVYNKTQGLVTVLNEPGPDLICVTDGRFRNEVLSILEVSGRVYKIECPQTTGAEALRAGVQGHSSEIEQRGIPNQFFSGIIINDKDLGLKVLEQKVIHRISRDFKTDIL